MNGRSRLEAGWRREARERRLSEGRWSVSPCLFCCPYSHVFACYLPPPGARPAHASPRALRPAAAPALASAHREDVCACGAAVDQRLARSDQGAGKCTGKCAHRPASASAPAFAQPAAAATSCAAITASSHW